MTQHRTALSGIEARSILSDRSFPRHSHDQIGVGVMRAGAHRSWSGIGTVEAGPGDVIMVNPGELHDGMPVGDKPREWHMLYFDPDKFADVARQEGVHDIEVVRPAVADPILSDCLERLFRSITDPSAEPMLIEQRLTAVVMRAMSEHGLRSARPSLLSPSIAKAVARIDADPAAAVTLRELAALCGVSPFQLLRGFHRDLGITPHAYLLQLRVRLAQRALQRRQAIAEAAANAGFADQSHLTRTFVRYLGVTPGAYVAAIA